VKLLIDECLHTSWVEVAHTMGHLADHVNYLGLGSSKDWQLMSTIRVRDYTFVTINHSLVSFCHPEIHERTSGKSAGFHLSD
jgi:predicted nuclease of predicted toxin-antitoxin system